MLSVFNHRLKHQEALPSTSTTTELPGLCPGEDGELSPAGGPALLETERLGVSLRWGLAGRRQGGGACSRETQAFFLCPALGNLGFLTCKMGRWPSLVPCRSVRECVRSARHCSRRTWPLASWDSHSHGGDRSAAAEKQTDKNNLKAAGGSEEQSNRRCEGGRGGAAYVGWSAEVWHKRSQP